MQHRIASDLWAIRLTALAWIAMGWVLLWSGEAVFAAGNETGYSVTLAWDANPEPDVIGYRIYYGTNPGSHPTVEDVGNTTTATVPMPSAGTYYVVATAYNSASLESLPSDEIRVIVVPVDEEAPVIADLPADLVVFPDSSGAPTATVTWSQPSATDNIGVVRFTSSHTSGSVFPPGITIVTYTAEDAAGNIATASFDVVVGGLELWRQQTFGSAAGNPAISGDFANTDWDRWNNLGEYALGLDPALHDGDNALTLDFEGDRIVLRFRHYRYLPDVVLRVECTDNVKAGWYTLATLVPGDDWDLDPGGATLSSLRTGNFQEVTITEPSSAKPTGYFRLIAYSTQGL